MRGLRGVMGSMMAAAVGAALLAGCAQKRVQEMVVFVPSADLQKAGLKEQWDHQVALSPGERIANAWRIDNSIYVTTNQASVIRLDAATGQQVWENVLPQTHETIFRPAETQDKKGVVVVNRGNAFCYSKESGALLMSRQLSMSVLTDPLVYHEILCLGGVNAYYGLWLDQLGGQKWNVYAPDDMFVTPPVLVGGDKLILTSRVGHLWRISPETGDWDWKDHKTNGLVVGAPAAGDKAIFAPAMDKRVYAFDLKDGHEIFDTRLEGTLNQPLTTTRTKVLVPTQEMGLYAIAQDKEGILWHVTGVTTVGTVTAGRVWVMAEGGILECLNLETGAVVHSEQIPAAQIIVRNAVDQSVITVNSAGVVASYTAQ